MDDHIIIDTRFVRTSRTKLPSAAKTNVNQSETLKYQLQQNLADTRQEYQNIILLNVIYAI